jgi:hypothetical protein
MQHKLLTFTAANLTAFDAAAPQQAASTEPLVEVWEPAPRQPRTRPATYHGWLIETHDEDGETRITKQPDGFPVMHVIKHTAHEPPPIVAYRVLKRGNVEAMRLPYTAEKIAQRALRGDSVPSWWNYTHNQEAA